MSNPTDESIRLCMMRHIARRKRRNATSAIIGAAIVLTAFAAVPVWICESIIPAAFGIIGLRYLVQSIQTLTRLIKGQEP